MENIKPQEQYWLDHFSGDIPLLHLPIDYTRPMDRDFTGGIVKFTISTLQTAGLRKLSEQSGTTLFMVLLSLYNILLYRISNQEDIVVGTPVAGRRHVDLEGIIGMFVNTLALRNFPTGRITVRDFLVQVKEHTLNAFENQEYPFENLVELLVEERDTSRNPLFDTMFSLANMEDRSQALPVLKESGLTIKPFATANKPAKFDFSLNCVEKGDSIDCELEYAAALFKPETVHRLKNYFLSIVSTAALNPASLLSRIEILSQEEQHRILYDFNDTRIDFPVIQDSARFIQGSGSEDP